MLRRAKQVFQYVLYELHDTYGEKLELEQELLVDLANIVGYIYNMESAILRTKKAIQETGEEKNQLKRLYTEVYVQETMEKVITNAKHALLAIDENDSQLQVRATLDKFLHQVSVNLIPKKREIARQLIEEEKYVV